MTQPNTATDFSINDMKTLIETMQIYKKITMTKG